MNIDKIGNWEITVLETGDFRLDGGAMMGSVPKVLWNKTNPADKKNRIDLSMRCLLLDDGQSRVLIESGIGDYYPENFKEMFHIKQPQYALSDTLSNYDYSYKDITHVVLTHLHFDHAGGCIIKDDRGCIKPKFPNAKYYVSKSNWKAALNPSPRDRASYLKENFLCLKEEGVLELFDDNASIACGIDTYNVNGHTKGQQLIKVSGGNEVLIFCSDLIPLKSHVSPPWIMGYDLNAELTLKEKEVFLDKAAKKGWILFFYHDPLTVAVKIKKDKKYYSIIDEIRRSN
tara:strand:+ start:106 stop:966 length:861 start_codon:yes stop_codon:yes gene_type:complete